VHGAQATASLAEKAAVREAEEVEEAGDSLVPAEGPARGVEAEVAAEDEEEVRMTCMLSNKVLSEIVVCDFLVRLLCWVEPDHPFERKASTPGILRNHRTTS
jgi:hypothetical protein